MSQTPMPTGPHAPGHGPERHGNIEYERRDFTLRTIMLFGLGLAALVGVTLWAMEGLKTRFERGLPPQRRALLQPETEDAVRSSAALIRLAQTGLSAAEQRHAEDSLLSGYGWVSREQGVVYIPIERAIDLVLEEGLPVRTTGSATTQPETGGSRHD